MKRKRMNQSHLRPSIKKSKGKGLSIARKHMYVTNIVSVSKIKYPIQLKTIVLGVHGKFGDIFPAAVSKQKNSQTTLATFHTGSIINTGAKTKEESLLATALLEYRYSQLYHARICTTDWNITNIVATCRLGYKLDMDKINAYYGYESGWWRPEVFPGFTLHQDDLEVSFIIFINGKVNVTGLKSLDQVPLAYERAQLLLEVCKQTNDDDDDDDDDDDADDDDDNVTVRCA